MTVNLHLMIHFRMVKLLKRLILLDLRSIKE